MSVIFSPVVLIRSFCIFDPNRQANKYVLKESSQCVAGTYKMQNSECHNEKVTQYNDISY